jgi:hypothetical protein
MKMLVTVLLVMLLLLPLVVSIAFLRKNHAQHIYLVWYLFSFSFVVLCSLITYSNVMEPNPISHSCNSFGLAYSELPAIKLVESISAYVTDLRGELLIISIVVGLVAVPQLLAYILSGISGSATTPIFVSKITQFAIWSLIKFLAVFSGLLMAYPVVELIIHTSCSFAVQFDYGYDFSIFVLSIINFSFSFGLMLIYFKGLSLLDYLYRNDAFYIVRRMHEYFTRYRSQ